MAAPVRHDASFDNTLILHPKASWLPFVWDRPLALLPDGTLVTVDDRETHRSRDGGLTWREIGPSAIEASTSPATIRRLKSGRLMLIWNRPFMEGKTEHTLYGGDGIATEVAISNQRRELSIAFSEDEGATFTPPAVLAALPGSADEKIMLAYPRVLEYKPGEIWVTSMQGGLHCRFLEKDLV